MENKILRTIVIPAYAEEKFISGTLDSLYDYLKELHWLNSTEVIVVTADAQDRTQEIVAKQIKKFPNQKHIEPGKKIGKGRDVCAGLEKASSDLVLFMDADLATPLYHIEKAFDIISRKPGMLIGLRRIQSIHSTLIRRVTSVLSNMLIRVFIGWDISDSQCGFKAFDKKTLKIILPRARIKGWGFDFEFIKIAKLQGVNISKLHIPDWHDPKPEGQGLSGDTQFSAMKKTLKELIDVKINQLKGYYR